MKKLIIITIASFTVLFASCHKTEEPIRFSILGDSYSTFQNHVDPNSNDVWPYYENIHVTDVSQMWWWQLVDSTGWHRIADRYSVECIDLYYVDKDWNHPTIAGQTIIAQQVMEALLLDGVIF